MKEQSLIHVKIDYDESIQSKKDLLLSERSFIRLLRTVKRFDILRKEELNTKLRAQKKMKELKLNLAKLHDILPKIRLPEILKKDSIEEYKPTKSKKEESNPDLENQLAEIQERLRRLG